MDMTEPIMLTKGTPGTPCPIAKTLDVIGTEWTFLIIRDLLIEGTMRFSDLQRSMEGISPKTLSLRLRELEEQGILTRKVSRSSAACRIFFNGKRKKVRRYF
jgi:DNA-binding HxlR family transcriptional regulator